MGKVDLTNTLKGDIGELIFEHHCQKWNYAYIRLEEIYNTLTPRNELVFRFGYNRIKVKLPDEIVDEIRLLCRPSNANDHDPSFTLDYLTISLRYSFDRIGGKYTQKPSLTPLAFHWVEIKTGTGQLTRNQRRLLGKTKIPIRVFRVSTEMPKKIEVHYDK